MAQEKAPAYQWYPKDYELDEAVKLMTYEQEGIYRRLLDHQALHGSIPAMPAQIAMLVPKVTLKRFLSLWPAIEGKFKPDGNRLVNAKLERVKANTAAFKESKSKGGANSVEARRRTFGTAQPNSARTEPRTEPRTESQAERRTGPEPASALASASATASVDHDQDQTQQPGSTHTPRSPKTALVGDARFLRFWAIYPNKKGKDDALKAWAKRHPTEALTDLIVAAVVAQQHWPEWLKEGGRFIPYPATWLNRGSWDDEPSVNGNSRVSDIGRQNAANMEIALQMLEGRDAGK